MEASSSDVLIGVFGRLSAEKGQSILLDAFKILHNQNDSVKILIVGDGVDRNKLESKVRKEKLSSNVKFFGHQTSMKKYYESIDLLVLPSLSEGLPNVVLEAMSMGKPVLATNVGAVSEVIKDGNNGWLVSANDHIALAKLLTKIVVDRQKLKEMGLKGRLSLFPKFSVESRCQKFLSVYNNLLNQE
jgi:glycosyltransferase involved in cell wall biosynthesis